MPRFTLLSTCGILLLVLINLTGCGSRETAVQRGNRDKILHLGNLSEPTSIDPQIISSLQDFQIVIGLVEGLTSYDPQTNKPIPAGATSWETSKDGLTWTFHLRPESVWSNGDPVTAEDYVWAYQRMLSPGLGAEYASSLFCLQGAKDFFEGKGPASAIGAEALDHHTLRLSFIYPVPYLPGLVAHSSWFPVHKATILKFGTIDDRTTRWTRAGNYIGNGPFTLKEWKPNQIIVLAKNPNYWNAADVHLNEVHIYPIESAATEEAAFRSGQLHITVSMPVDKIAVYDNDPALAPLHKSATNLATYFYRFNVNRVPFNDVRVRRALSMAINRAQIVEKVTKGGQPPAYTLTPPETNDYTAPSSIRYDLARARELLAEAGYPGGKGFPPVELLYNTNDGHRAIAEALQQMWREALGINIGIYNQEAKVWNDTMRQLDYQIARYAWVGDYLDPSTFLELMTSENGNNQTGWANATYDSLVFGARDILDQEARYAQFRKAEALLMDESPIAPLYFYNKNWIQTPSVHGWYGNLLDIHPYQGITLDDPAP